MQSKVTTSAGARPAAYVAMELRKEGWLACPPGTGFHRTFLHRLATGEAAGLLALNERFRRTAAGRRARGSWSCRA